MQLSSALVAHNLLLVTLNWALCAHLGPGCPPVVWKAITFAYFWARMLDAVAIWPGLLAI